MEKATIIQNLSNLFHSWSGEQVASIDPLPLSGSYRQYYRIVGKSKRAIGAFNFDNNENNAFISFTKHFHSKGLNVPNVLAENLELGIYLIQDLGETTLFAKISELTHENEVEQLYKQVIVELPKFQIVAAKDLDYTVCYPRAAFDKQSMRWDLNYFKYYFLKLAQVPFDEQALEDDFSQLSTFLLQAESDYFMYRDCQSRNIMLFNNSMYFIDYQGGRKGALQYDVASLLYDAKANLSQDLREKLLNFYIDELQKYIKVDRDKFTSYYYGFVLIRILQAMGAYGFRGYYEKKEHFLQSIPYALKNLEWLLTQSKLSIKLDALKRILEKIIHSNQFKSVELKNNNLQVSIHSFSFKNALPIDTSGNGGGFVFDCRAIHNPGRFPEYQQLTGKDKEVIDFLNKEKSMHSFLQGVYQLVDQAVENYISRDFTSLMISFGCTGGQHRSVYCAEQLASHLALKYRVRTQVKHNELEKKN